MISPHRQHLRTGRLTLAFGSRYGFAVAPAVGRCVADHLAGLPTPELDQLTTNRIAYFDPAHVAAFLAESATSNVLGSESNPWHIPKTLCIEQCNG